MRSPAGIAAVALRVDFNKLQAAGDSFGLVNTMTRTFSNAVIEHEQHFRDQAVVIGID